ncbi:MAG: prolipoprotein diacylglyceryl transferase [Phycisphaerales bacterium]|nr:prolipoprotein diacylglyceryl transferase [Phycisphaerales bacterium]
MVLAAWLHDLDPFAWRISGSFGVRWYGLSYVAGFILAWLLLTWMAGRRLIVVPRERVADLILAVVVGTIAGGRLGYVLIYRPELLWTFSPSAPWWGVLDLAHGGMASHGGMIGIILACWWCSRQFRVPALHITDCIALAAPPGIFLGRCANFVNGELLGKIAAAPGEPAPWWAVKFPQELLERPPRLDADQARRLTELLADRLPASLGLAPGEGAAAIAAGAVPESALDEAKLTLIADVQRRIPGVAEKLAPLLSARHPSQLYQAFAEGVVLFAALAAAWAWTRPERTGRHGLVTAWFFIVYGVGRIATEFIRLPDAHLAVQRIAGLSRGQWLSVLMVVAGGLLLAWAHRRGGRPGAAV